MVNMNQTSRGVMDPPYSSLRVSKFLDQAGVEYLWSKISMEDYPNNEMLMAIINAIDETKADKVDVIEIVDTKVQEYINEAILGGAW